MEVPDLTRTLSEGERAAVLAALAGVRAGDRVVAIGVGPVVLACLAAGSGEPTVDPRAASPGCAQVVVVGTAPDVPRGRHLLAPGGRLVAVAADAGAARRVATGAGLALRHVEALGDQVAWSATLPVGPPEP